jgi:hypothetical protein
MNSFILSGSVNIYFTLASLVYKPNRVPNDAGAVVVECKRKSPNIELFFLRHMVS